MKIGISNHGGYSEWINIHCPIRFEGFQCDMKGTIHIKEALHHRHFFSIVHVLIEEKRYLSQYSVQKWWTEIYDNLKYLKKGAKIYCKRYITFINTFKFIFVYSRFLRMLFWLELFLRWAMLPKILLLSLVINNISC